MSPSRKTGQQSDWYRIALASIGDAVIVTDAQGRVTFMNPVAEALTGWAEAEALGQLLPSLFRVVHEQTRQPVNNPVLEVISRDTMVELANYTLLIARDGTERPIDDSAAPIRDAAGGLAGTVLIFRDISQRRQSERVVENALAYAEGIVDTVRESLMVLDAGLRVRTANQSFYRTFGVAAPETEGRKFFDLGNHQWDVPRLRELLDGVLQQDSAFNDFEVHLDFENIGRRAMLLNGRRLFRRGDGVEFILLALEDVTEHQNASNALGVSETRYRRLFETAQDGILILDADTRLILDANPFLLDMLGYTAGELTGKELWQIGLFRDIEASRVAFRRLQAKGYIRYDDLPLQTNDGRHIEVEFVSNVYLVGENRVIQCNIRDVTDRKRAEDALREAHDQLERRVEERTGELAKVNEALQAEVAEHGQAEAARLELLQRLATAQEEERHRIARELHDQMGQHLTAFSLGLKSLKDSTPEPDPAYQRLQQLQNLAELMGKEVHRLALELRPTALDDLGLHTALLHYVDAWSESCRTEVDFQCIGLEGERLPPALETALYRVVQEALTNVLKHGQARRVSLILQRSLDQVSAVIEDDGLGFDTEVGFRATGRLGLLGMQERLALVGGSLTVESLPGNGTTVFARIPFSVAGGRTVMTNLRIFLADDHAVVREGLKSLINAQADMEVIGEAGDGRSACEQVLRLLPDVVVLDVSMPEMTGAQAAERLKLACPEVKVLALTVHEDKGYLRQLLEAGAVGYVLKRAAAEELIRAIRTVAGGGVYLDPALAGKVVGGFVRKPLGKRALEEIALSDREVEVVRLVAAGHSNKEIAGRLDISVKTVETYKARSLEKLGLRSRADLVRYALQRGWLQDV